MALLRAARRGAKILSKADTTPALNSAFGRINADISDAMNHSPQRGGAMGNQNFFNEKISQNYEALAEVDPGKLGDSDYANYANTAMALTEFVQYSDVPKTGYFKNFEKVSNDQMSFESEVQGINKSLMSADAGTEGFSKYTSAIKNSIKNSKKSAIGLAGDNPLRSQLNEFYSGKSTLSDLGNAPEFSEILDIGGLDKRIETARSKDGFSDYISRHSSDGRGDGVVQRMAKFYNPKANPSQMAADIDRIHKGMFKSVYGKEYVALTADESAALSSAASLRHVEKLQSILKKEMDSSADFADKAFRIDANGKHFSHKWLYQQNAKLIDELNLKMDRHKKRKAYKEGARNSTGSKLEQLKNKGLFNIRKSKELISDELKYWVGESDDIGSLVFDQFVRGGGKTPPGGISQAQVESAINKVAKGAYIAKLNNLKVAGVEDLVRKLKKSFPDDFDIENKELLSYLEEKVGRAIRNDDVLDYIESIFDGADFNVFTEADAKKLLKSDHSLSSKKISSISENLKQYRNNFIFSNKGDLMQKDNFIDLSATSFKTIGESKFIDGGDMGDAARRASAEFDKINNAGKIDKWKDYLKNLFPALTKIFKNEGLNDASRLKYSGYIRELNKSYAIGNDASLAWKKKNLSGKYDPEYIGMFRGGRLPSDKGLGARYQYVIESMDAVESKLEELNYFEKDFGREGRRSSRVSRTKLNAIPESLYDEAEISLRAKIQKAPNDLKKHIQSTITELKEKGYKMDDIATAVADTVNPVDAALTRYSRLAGELQKLSFVSQAKKRNILRFKPAPGFRKLDSDVFNPQILKEALGSSAVYLPEVEVQQASRIFKDFRDMVITDAKGLAIEANTLGNRVVRHNLLSNNLATRPLAEIGNFIMFMSMGVPMKLYWKTRKLAWKGEKEFSPMYKEFMGSGMASESPQVSGVIDKRDFKNMKEGPTKSKLDKYDPTNPDSDISAQIMDWSLGAPDRQARYQLFLIGKMAGKSNDEIAKTIRNSFGLTSDLPDVVQKFSEIPGGDIFARYTYTMGANMLRMLAHNPKHFVKTAAYAAAMQQATMYAFLTPEERQNVKRGKKWMKPSIWNSMKIDPSIALPGGRYMAAKYLSPFDLSVSSPYDSMNPISQAIRHTWEGRDAEYIAKKNIKAYRKTSSTIKSLGEGKLDEALINTLGVGVVRNVRSSQTQKRDNVSFAKYAQEKNKDKLFWYEKYEDGRRY